MELYIFILIVLFITAMSDLVVGVSNDAVNFLNSAVGSKAASRKTILIIASLGVLVGTTFSSGMMEVARKGIFNPEYFVMHEVLIIFLAVMLTDILLLDLYNTFALPTSTTVSIVFEIFGGAVAIALIKVTGNGEAISNVLSYINTKNVITIISGIGLSVVFAFFFGSIIQFLTRTIFTFNYEKTFKRYGSIYSGLALTIISFFIMIKGAKGSSLVTPETTRWLMSHLKEFFVISFIAWTIFWQILISFTKINVLRIIVLIGTFALALAFAANDLVNFIGAPLGALSAFKIGNAAGADPFQFTMEALGNPVRANTWILLLSGTIMVITLWKSRKAQGVTRTEVNLGRQEEGVERFESSALARGIVRMGISLHDIYKKIAPLSLQNWLSQRINPESSRLEPAKDGEIPAFDLLRATINLMVASALVSLGTSLKLPLSTTFVTFMVAMATSLSDKAWGSESAVYRVNGVLTVLGGWFFTAFMAFSSCFLFSLFIYFVKLPAIIILLAFGLFFLFRSARIHRQREDRLKSMELESGIRIDLDDVDHILIRMSKLVSDASNSIDLCFHGLINNQRKELKKAKKQAQTFLADGDIIIGEIFNYLKKTRYEEKGPAQHYARMIGTLQIITTNINSLANEFYRYIDNNHKIPDQAQADEMKQVNDKIQNLLNQSSKMLDNRQFKNIENLAQEVEELNETIYHFDLNQMKRIKSGKSKSRQSLLFVSALYRVRRITEQSVNLTKLSNESIKRIPERR